MKILKQYKYLFVAAAIIILIGIVSTVIHIYNRTAEIHEVLTLNINLLILILLVSAGLIIRFFKWHFFMRFYDFRLKIRQSFQIFFAGLFVNLFFPLLIGEVLTKNYFLKKEGYTGTVRNISVIILERSLDIISVVILGLLFAATAEHTKDIISTGNFIYTGIGLLVLFVLISIFSVKLKFSYKLLISFLAGVLGWIVIYMIYFTFPKGLTDNLTFGSFGTIFSNYLVFYPATPMGIFISGNYLFLTMEKFITNPQLLLQIVINIRIASIVPSLIIGAISFIKLTGKKKADTEFHFDEIADEYTDMIPEHIRDRLLGRKCRLISENLDDNKVNKTGLDLGGGKGWYTSKMKELTNANIILVEYSYNQALDAVKRDPDIPAIVADISNLPFKDNSVDFGFSINVFHHLPDRQSQLKAFDSFSRVLKPGKKFFLHEMNVHNMLFRIYMNYFFPLIKSIDEGNEWWIDPGLNKFGNFISEKIIYFTFIPDFISSSFMKILLPIEKRLEKSGFAKYSAHYLRIFENRKDAD